LEWRSVKKGHGQEKAKELDLENVEEKKGDVATTDRERDATLEKQEEVAAAS
jgi:hypothetical protein